MDILEKLARLLAQAREDEQPLAGAVLASYADRLQRVLSELFDTAFPAVPGETVAVAWRAPKTAALIYDRVWAFPSVLMPEVPDEIRVYGGTPYEAWTIAGLLLLKNHTPRELFDCVYEPMGVRARSALKNYEKYLSDGFGERMVAAALADAAVCTATPVFSSKSERLKQFNVGSYEVIALALTNIALVDEDYLSWEQVIELRKDTRSRAAYRRLTHWLDSTMADKSYGYIVDDIAVRLDAYERALKKHGIMTAIGAIESIIDHKFIVPTALVGSAIAFAGLLDAAALATTALIGAKAAVTAARGLVDLQFGEARSSEVAFVHEVKRLKPRGLTLV